MLFIDQQDYTCHLERSPLADEVETRRATERSEGRISCSQNKPFPSEIPTLRVALCVRLCYASLRMTRTGNKLTIEN